LAQFRDSYDTNATRSEVGAVVEAADGIARVSGLPSVMANELLEFPGGVLGVAQNLDEREIGAVVLGSFEQIKEGDEVRRTGEVLSIPVGDA
ncbi:F0F1 ATP synthase subunit alpha, partial [Klebsiella pneumoniae]|nr:F0F1 ATP synthase subunit alpha [Klebsiella pneumoniae]